jgi:putative flippase GtrA
LKAFKSQEVKSKMAETQSLKHSAYWFMVVGASAALVHYVIAVTIEHFSLLTPALANMAGFISAFPVSYFGHSSLSFAQQDTSHQQSLPRFLLVAITGFCANQSLLIFCLNHTNLPFWFVLGLVMVIIAISTYVLSRYWAFKVK